jgi:dinuclear metal center YbgI/SA1388 family protein
MAFRDDIVKYINCFLNSSGVQDISQNGLQVEGTENVKKIVFGVSANMELFEEAASGSADMIIVHHGLLWGQNPRVTGLFKKRIEFLIKNNISLCAWHLPLDKHKTVGNNAQIAKKLGLKKIVPFGEYHGVEIGFKGVFAKPLSLKEIEGKLGLKANEIFNSGPARVKSTAIVSGGGHGMFEAAAERKVDLFITGSSEEYVQAVARERGVNYMAFGHYNTETFGVKALMVEVNKKFAVKTEFVGVENKI